MSPLQSVDVMFGHWALPGSLHYCSRARGLRLREVFVARPTGQR